MPRKFMSARVRAALVLVPAMALAVAACSSGGSSSSSSAPKLTTLVVGMPAESDTLDPTGAGDPTTYAVFESMFDDVLGRDSTGKIVPGLASSYQQVTPKQLDLTIRSGVKFHDGSTLSAADVKFSIEHILDPKLAFPDATAVSCHWP